MRNGHVAIFNLPNRRIIICAVIYSVAFSCLRDMLYESILQAKKIENSDQYALTATKIEEIEKNLAEEKAKYELWIVD